MERQVGCLRCFEALREDLAWELVHMPVVEPVLQPERVAEQREEGAYLVGFLNFLRPHQVQVAGQIELAYLRAQPGRLEPFLLGDLRLLVLCDGELLTAEALHQLRSRGVAIFCTQQGPRMVLVRLQHYLQRHLAPRTQLHGVLVDVLGVGILIQGEAGIGKSELALELVSRHHRLVADDSVLCIREAPNVITGHCPAALHNYMEVRGLGILNIRELFGASAIVDAKRLRLIIEIRNMGDRELADLDRLQGQVDQVSVLDVLLPRLQLPVSAARNLAILVEAAARTQYVKESGGDMLANFDAQARRAQDWLL